MITTVLHKSYDLDPRSKAYELRLDKLPPKKLDDPVIFKITDLTHLDTLLALEPDYIDIPYDQIPKRSFGKTKLIASYHNFEETPDLESILMSMPQADYHKIATMAHSTLDSLRMLTFVQKHTNIIGLCMGEHGKLTRLLGPVVGNPITYLVKDRGIAHGEIHLDEWPNITPSTSIYGLIGHPVSQSLSHITHNAIFKNAGINAYYIKIDIPPQDFDEAMKHLRNLPIKGLSVTMPYKEKFSHSPINTLWEEINTDGIGALDALENHIAVKNKTIAILGRGGTAKAIAAEAKKRGARAHLYGRNQTPTTYDILINATPVGMDKKSSPVPFVLPGRAVFDCISNPIETPLLKMTTGIKIYGYELFARQAALQFESWLPGQIDPETIIATITAKAQELLF